MSVDQVKAFFDKVRADETLREEVKSLRGIKGKEPMVEAMMKMAQAQGFSFDEQALEAGWGEWRKQLPSDHPLSDSELEAVAGGALCTYGL